VMANVANSLLSADMKAFQTMIGSLTSRSFRSSSHSAISYPFPLFLARHSYTFVPVKSRLRIPLGNAACPTTIYVALAAAFRSMYAISFCSVYSLDECAPRHRRS
jgi:hypothetical protein